MAKIICTVLFLFLRSYFVLSCTGQNCMDTSLLPSLEMIQQLVTQYQQQFSNKINTELAFYSVAAPKIFDATTSNHKTRCRGELYGSINLYPDLDQPYVLFEFTAEISKGSKPKNDIKMRFSFSDDFLAKNPDYQNLIKKPDVRKIEIEEVHPKKKTKVNRTWYELPCDNSRAAADFYDSKMFDINKKKIELPIYSCFVKGIEIYAIYDFRPITSPVYKYDLSDLRADVHALHPDWPLYIDGSDIKDESRLECSIIPPPGTEYKYMLAKK